MRATTVTIPAGARLIDSVQRFTPAQIRSLGAVGTCRYYAPRRGDGSRNPKCLTPAEISELHAGGIGVIPNWESSSTRPLGGASAGSIDGHSFAQQLVLDSVPNEALVIVSCDMDAIPGGSHVNRSTVEPYFRTALAELARVGYTHQGVYGDTDLFRWLADLDVVGWLMVSPAFSDGTKFGTSIWQRYQSTWNEPRTVPLAGIPNNAYDPNDVLADVPGVWLPNDGPAHRPDPTPTPIPPEEDEMSTFIITNGSAFAVVYGTGIVTGLAGGDVDAAIAKFGQPISTDPAVFDDFAGKSDRLLAPSAAATGAVQVDVHAPTGWTVTSSVTPEPA